ncbi:glutamyl-tRNA reductase [Microbacterium terricola]|uniref:Glutamyl-tRNA reductase n=1 Tax=Microbacterium terricola TaxID=344163 RepID=A0ABM8DZP9_9MICO|nr:glutamyl-tRNA reductase [Microbacterium terricola]UYK41091.1 glutamyl-tRNA reductase [Microbacterium terricola]BDV31148.1 glutamyl-tRNA reductase [Microbacterium terricola]
MLFCVTANHRNTDFEVLDRISKVSATTAADVLNAHEFVRGAVVLATCNRFEAYLELDEPVTSGAVLAHEAVLDAVASVAGDDALSLRDSAVALVGDDAVRHLFAVSSGLESMVVGEDEITGQVQRALAAAREIGTTSTELEQVFQRAAYATRAVRAKADLSAAGRSLARLALDLVDTRVTDWATTPVLLVGTGQYAATTIAALQARGARDIRVFSATGRAQQFAARYGVRAEPTLGEALAGADIVITCTARYVITPDDIPDTRQRLIIDLGLPRNVDPAVGAVGGVELLDLELIGRHASLPELSAGAHEVVGSAVATYAAERAAAPAVVALRSHIQQALMSELSRLRVGEDEARTEAALRHFAGVLSHAPSVRAREFAAQGRIEEFEAALEMVFGVSAAPAEDADGEQLAAG